VIKRTLKLWQETGEVAPFKEAEKKRRLWIMTDGEIQVSSIVYSPSSCSPFDFIFSVPFCSFRMKIRYVSG
jgi:hypothetical protein